MTRNLYLFVAFLLVAGCNDKEESSAYSEIYARPAFAPLSDSIKNEPNRDDLYFRRAVLLNKENFPEPALDDFRKAWELKREEKYAFGISTILLEKNPGSAITFISQALKELPQSNLLRLKLARSYYAQNKPDSALMVSNDVLTINPQQTEALILKAEILDTKGKPLEAQEALETAYRVDPADIILNNTLAMQYAVNRNPKVIALCDSLIRMDSLGIHGEPYFYKGIYFSNINDKVKALWHFNEAIKHDYYFLDAHIEKGIVLFDQKKFEEAYQAFNLAMTISPKYAPAYYWMAKCQEAQGQAEEAKLNYQRAFGLDKSLTEAKEAADRLSK